MVGNGNIHFVSALTANNDAYTSMRHEAGAVAAADAYHRTTGKIGVATTTYGPGFTNALTPLSEALHARIPVVYVLGDIPTFGRRPIDVDEHALLTALGVPFVVAGPHNAEEVTRWAFHQAFEDNSPIVVLIPYDLVDATLSDPATTFPVSGPTIERSRRAGDPDISAETLHDPARADALAEELACDLVGAKRPIILVGRGVINSGTLSHVESLGEDLGALFMTSVMARNCVPDQWNLGIAGGFMHRGRLDVVRRADVVLVLGASLNMFQVRKGTLFGERTKIFHVDREPQDSLATVHKQVAADLKVILPKLVQAVARQHELTAHVGDKSEGARGWRPHAAGLPACERDDLDPGCFQETASDGRLDPRFVLRRLDELLPDNRTVVTDGGHFIGWVPKYIDCPDARSTVLVGTAVMTIGLGLSSAVGATIGRPDRCTALFTGDGGALMGLADLEVFFRVARQKQHMTCGEDPQFRGIGPGEQEPSAVMIVLNDAAYGAEVHQYVPRGLDPSAMLLEDQNFAAMGEPWGVAGLTVTTPEQFRPGGEVEQFLKAQAGDPCILDVKISRIPVADFLKE